MEFQYLTVLCGIGGYTSFDLVPKSTGWNTAPNPYKAIIVVVTTVVRNWLAIRWRRGKTLWGRGSNAVKNSGCCEKRDMESVGVNMMMMKRKNHMHCLDGYEISCGFLWCGQIKGLILDPVLDGFNGFDFVIILCGSVGETIDVPNCEQTFLQRLIEHWVKIDCLL